MAEKVKRVCRKEHMRRSGSEEGSAEVKKPPARIDPEVFYYFSISTVVAAPDYIMPPMPPIPPIPPMPPMPPPPAGMHRLCHPASRRSWLRWSASERPRCRRSEVQNEPLWWDRLLRLQSDLHRYWCRHCIRWHLRKFLTLSMTTEPSKPALLAI